ncbi:MAG: LysE family translocator [Paraburkholderia sp.]|jgi:homoserine/homoserine lactone efflux protein|uniref:LysE family translocator n=2 Tax=Burkholderiales TaxID=80840 RepID=UPI0010F66863|nr:LysE family translocator [Burkholderia sp. 4M9327F10]
MLGWDIWVLFFGYAVPMVISPGPGNTLLASSGGRFGVRGSLWFWAGFEDGNLVLCLLYGLGLGRGLQSHPGVHEALKWAGTAYLLYLAWSFLRSSAKPAASGERVMKQLTFVDGFVAVLLNPKIHSMILVMFSQFLDPAKPIAMQVLQLTGGFLLVGLACHFPWIYGGKVILGRFTSERAVRIQGWVFGACMLLVAAYVVFA